MAIMDYMSKLPSPDQMTPVTNDTITGTDDSQDTAEDVHAQFISVSPAVPSDSVIFIEVTDMTLPLSPGMGFQVPKVDMGYQFSDTKKNLLLRNKAGVDVNTSNIVIGKFIEDDNTYTYSYDWDAGNAPDITLYGLEILFVGVDGRVAISYDGKIIDMMPGQKYESNNKDSTNQKVFKIVNYGLIPRSGVQVVDEI
ncbi:hypothetical protein CUJ83_11575 [Methanocella sp. CWC-04]|uniref:Uncharacterized protein n=2 Tax=Methanooceanicella nereidis TaxID=2052831 RepID=A0AAP2RG57_9EURY|nr:hypothetical protein [Methanocella sp. CWC-04]